MTTAGRPRVLMAGIPAMTMREIRLQGADETAERHWTRGRCWCGTGHGVGETGLTMVVPPWDVARDGEAIRWVS